METLFLSVGCSFSRQHSNCFLSIKSNCQQETVKVGVGEHNTLPSYLLLYSFKRYASFRNSLNEILYEEDEEEIEEPEKTDSPTTTIPFSFRLD